MFNGKVRGLQLWLREEGHVVKNSEISVELGTSNVAATLKVASFITHFTLGQDRHFLPVVTATGFEFVKQSYLEAFLKNQNVARSSNDPSIFILDFGCHQNNMPEKVEQATGVIIQCACDVGESLTKWSLALQKDFNAVSEYGFAIFPHLLDSYGDLRHEMTLPSKRSSRTSK